jgi:hypothetical protein
MADIILSGGRTVTPAASPAEIAQFLSTVDRVLASEEGTRLADDLAAHVKACFEEAKNHRASRGVDKQMDDALLAVRSQYTTEEIGRMSAEDANIYAGITGTKFRAGRAWLLDILANAIDKPWTIEPTPLPDVPPDVENSVVDKLQAEAASMGITDPAAIEDNEALRELARSLLPVALSTRKALAQAAAGRIALRIEDRMTEGGWRTAFEEFSADLMMHPIACIKGPFIERQKRLKWQDGTLTAVEQDVLVVRRVSPYDLYPAPGSSDTVSAPYLIERVQYTRDKFLALTKLTGVDEAALRAIVVEYPSGYDLFGVDSGAREAAEGSASVVRPHTSPAYTYDVLVYVGLLPADMLAVHGVPVPDVQAPAEAEVWVVGDRVIRAVLNEHPLGSRGYYVSSFQPIPGQFWGRSLPDVLRDTQRMCNASLRALARNMAYSAGPIGEYDANRLLQEQDVNNVSPYRMYAVETDQFAPTRSPALRFHVVPSTARELLAVYNEFMKQADDLSGIPAYVLGNPQVAGAGRTLGGLSMLMGNAAKGIKAVIGHVDKNVFEPLVTNMYVLLMLSDTVPEEDKVDVSVKARGSTGLLARELSQTRALEFLQLLTGYATLRTETGAPLVPAITLQRMIRSVAENMGFTADEVIPDPDRAKQLQGALSGGTPSMPAAIPTAAPGTPMPVLDARSAQPPEPGSAERLPDIG